MRLTNNDIADMMIGMKSLSVISDLLSVTGSLWRCWLTAKLTRAPYDPPHQRHPHGGLLLRILAALLGVGCSGGYAAPWTAKPPLATTPRLQTTLRLAPTPSRMTYPQYRANTAAPGPLARKPPPTGLPHRRTLARRLATVASGVGAWRTHPNIFRAGRF